VGNKKTLRINLEDLYLAMDNNFYELEYYLDLESGEVIMVSAEMDEPEMENLKEAVAGDPDRYKSIPKARSDEGYNDMRDFIATVQNVGLAEKLEEAIRDNGAFRRFKGALIVHPEERDRWFKFQTERQRERAIDWLDSIDIVLAT
jgi:hypothetical protein